MTNEYWLNRWKTGDTGWHQKDVEPALVSFFSNLKSRKVLVPLCGKSLDLIWLATHGHQVLGIELSEFACEAFFSENQIPFQKEKKGNFQIFKANSILIFNGDLFQLPAEWIQGFDAIYDRAALIALSAKERKAYSKKMMEFIKPSDEALPPPQSLEFLQIILERRPSDEIGPPYSVTKSELNSLYGECFKASLISEEEVNMGPETSAKTIECVYRME